MIGTLIPSSYAARLTRSRVPPSSRFVTVIGATDCSHSLPHPGQSHAGVIARRESHAIVIDAHSYALVLMPDGDLASIGIGMSHDVTQRLLHHPRQHSTGRFARPARSSRVSTSSPLTRAAVTSC